MTVLIVSAIRTPIGSFNGLLSSLNGNQLGTIAINECIKRANIDSSQINEVIMGHVLTAGEGQNPARQASVNAGIPFSVPAFTVSMVCGSGLKAVALAADSIKSGSSSIVVAGGQESMSKAPHLLHLRNPLKFGDASMIDSCIKDGLMDSFNDIHMGITAENIAEKYSISRKDQDEFSLNSQKKCEMAKKNGFFKDEIVSVKIKNRQGIVEINEDEYPKAGCTIQGFEKLRPAFKSDGTVTAGNASGLNDGAAALLLMDMEKAKRRNITGLACIVSWAQAGVDPKYMGLGPIPAIRLALEKANWTVDDVDLFELNEAFAAQSISVIKELKLDVNKINVSGGAIALGHPIGASGARILVTLIYALKRLGLRKGLCSLCIGGGMGIAVCIELC